MPRRSRDRTDPAASGHPGHERALRGRSPAPGSHGRHRTAADQRPSYVSVISLAELRLGVELLEEGRRRSELLHHVRSIQNAYQGRTLPLTATAVENYAINVDLLRRRGISISVNDAYIAATAVTHDAVLFTRDLKDFQGYPGLQMVSPWPSPHTGTHGA